MDQKESPNGRKIPKPNAHARRAPVTAKTKNEPHPLITSRRGMRPHPEGVLPVGNAYLLPPEEAAASARAKRDGLGAFASLDDALILRVLAGGDDDDDEGVGPDALACLACCSRAARAFAYHEDLWKAATLRAVGGDFRFTGGAWRRTYARCVRATPTEASSTDDDDCTRVGGGGAGRRGDAPVGGGDRSKTLFSDALYLRHLGAHLPLDPEWLAVDSIPRVDARDTNPARFARDFESVNRPVIVSGLCADWPATRGEWTRDRLLATHGDVKFTVGGYQMRLRDFYAYGDDASDDLPLYLFDKKFCEKAPSLAAGYSPPNIFADDLFALLGENDRPDHRWLIAGCERSGSGFHKDPNATSAWNAVVTGRKKWILFAPDATPPGVHPSADGSAVVQPVTLVEWYMNFYGHVYETDEDDESETDEDDGDEADEDEEKDLEADRSSVRRRRRRRRRANAGTSSDAPPRVMEGICGPGDVLFVPSGWWHMALNLEECVAVTQNFCSPRTLPRVLRFLRDAGECAELVSGTCRTRRGSLYERFVAVLAEKRPEELAAAERYLALGTRAPARYGGADESFTFKSTDRSSNGAIDDHVGRDEKRRRGDPGAANNAAGFDVVRRCSTLSDAFRSGEGGSFSFNF